jgi:hypothetical protein
MVRINTEHVDGAVLDWSEADWDAEAEFYKARI